MKRLFKYAISLQLAWYCLQLSVVAQGQTVQQQFLSPHNDARAEVGVDALVWDNIVAAYAQNYSVQRMADCALQHSGGQYGENLFKGIGIADPVGSAVLAWVQEKQYYDYSSNSCAEGQVCGHYTQVVWRDTLRLGCAQAKCKNNWTFVTCNYDPPGNYVGERPYEEASANLTGPPGSTNLTTPPGSTNLTTPPRLANLPRPSTPLSGNSTHPSGKKISKIVPILLGSVVGPALFVILCLVFGRSVRQWKSSVRTDKNLDGRGDFGQVFFDYKVLRDSTGNFDRNNMLGKGGFGEVYKGRLPDGRIVAVKKLNGRHETAQGAEDFLREVRVLTSVRHRNLVRLLGCCTRGRERLLVYEYMSNNSLNKHLFGEIKSDLSWESRLNIIVGTARGLAYLHEDSIVRIIHRDIKCGNILLDDKFYPKIADFGLAKFFPEDQTHVSTRVGGTIGYTAPEYAVHGQLTEKADIYSYGIVVLEIVSGRKCVDGSLPEPIQLLLQWVWNQYENNQVLDIVDPTLERKYPREQALRVITIALLCTQGSRALRPTMSQVASMLTNDLEIPVQPTQPAFLDAFAGRPTNSSGTSNSATSASTPVESHGSVSVSLTPR